MEFLSLVYILSVIMDFYTHFATVNLEIYATVLFSKSWGLKVLLSPRFLNKGSSPPSITLSVRYAISS